MDKKTYNPIKPKITAYLFEVNQQYTHMSKFVVLITLDCDTTALDIMFIVAMTATDYFIGSGGLYALYSLYCAGVFFYSGCRFPSVCVRRGDKCP